MGELYRAVARHGHEDRFLELLAGLHRVAVRFDEIVARHAPVAGYATAPAAGPEVVELLLGAIAIRQRLAVCLDVAPISPEPSVAANQAQESLLR